MDDEGMGRSREILFGLLVLASPAHNNYGLWAHPDDRKAEFNSLDFWVDLAQAAERAKLDVFFMADVLGVASGYQGSMRVSIEQGQQIPQNDGFTIIAALAGATRHIGLAATVSATYEPPYTLARRIATLDHLSKGRAGWNVVMSYSPNANEDYGLDPAMVDSASRYDRADEYLEVCYELWEDSWDDDAILLDRARRIYADPEKVRRIDHVGEHFSVAGPFQVSPSPQRTPTLFQAGASERGRDFAARHAEVTFVAARRDDALVQAVQSIRQKAVEHGRRPYDIKVMAIATVLVGRTLEEAEEKLRGYQEHSSAEGYLAHFFGAGFDPSGYPRDMLLSEAMADAGHSTTKMHATAPGGKGGQEVFPEGTTVGDMMDRMADVTNVHLFAFGTPEMVADRIEEWVERFDLDGFNLRSLVYPGSVEDFGELVVPELQRRGRYKQDYREGGTLREQVFGPGRRRLSERHPGSPARRRAGDGDALR